MSMDFEGVGLRVADVLLPAKGVDVSKWAVIACDQKTSEPRYWEKVAEFVDDAPSTLNIIFPEVYLEDANGADRVRSINNAMKRYLDDGVLVQRKGTAVLVDRSTPHVASRKGLVVALDLERYDYAEGSQTLIRATEGTIVDRLPPRIEVRKDAPLESPHIMVLIDDPDRTVIEPLFDNYKDRELLYDTELMFNGGRVKGFAVDDPDELRMVADALVRLADPAVFKHKYGVKDQSPLLFAMGDGNHSFATAKAIWQQCKKQGASMDDPARFALVELVNVHDDGLVFEPIHRLLFNIDVDDFLRGFVSAEVLRCDDFASVHEEMAKKVEDEHRFGIVSKDGFAVIVLKKPKATIEAGTVQSAIDKYLKKHPKAKVDYVHESSTVRDLGVKQGNLGIFLPSMQKVDFFRTVVHDGALPRKTFSMGEAEEKRYYLECRRIK